MRIRVLIGGAVVAVAYFVASSLPAFSADNGTINAQVTPAAPCITLDKTSLNFGTAPFSPQQGVSSFQVPGSVTSCTGTAQKLYGRGTDAKNAAASVTWTLDDSGQLPCNLANNQYQLSAGDSGGTNNWGVYLSTANKQLLGTGGMLAANTTRTIDSGLRMPCAGSDGAGQAMSWQYIYTATF